MTTAFTPFTTANAVSSIDLLRPTDQPPSPEETLDVTIAAWTQAQQVEITPTPHDATQAEHFLHSRRTALQDAAHTAYLTAFENASPETRDSLLQTLHQDRLTLTGWANNQAQPTLTEIDRTALRREYNSLFGFPIITEAPAVRWISQMTAGHPLLEIGAGNGYLASELIKANVNVIRHRSPPHRRRPRTPHPHGTRALRGHTATHRQRGHRPPPRTRHPLVLARPQCRIHPRDPPKLRGQIPRLHRRGYLRQHRLTRVSPRPRNRLRPGRILPNTDIPRAPRPHSSSTNAPDIRWPAHPIQPSPPQPGKQHSDPTLPTRRRPAMTNDWQQIKRAALTRNFQQIPLDNVIVTAAVGMFHQGNIQGLETQHQLVRDLRPTDLEHFETALVNQGVIHPFDPDTLGQRVHSLPTFRRHPA